jgi:regulator of protease activity HflC (stomatin/prohibitin superfamily)
MEGDGTMKGRFNAIANIVLLVAAGLAAVALTQGSILPAVLVGLFGLYLSLSPRMLQEWERGILLRLGRFSRVLGPGISWTFPGFDRLVKTVDMRIRSTAFSAEKTLTQDTVPVNVDAVLFWVVTDAKKAVIEVEDYESTVSWAAQTTLRDVIGHSELVRMISDREAVDAQLQEIIDAKTTDWGVTVQSVEIRDVRIPGSLEDAMSRKAQADREREARIILAESELQVANQMDRAAKIYERDPVALQIRAMNMTYESIKERGALMVVPSNMVSSMSGVIGMASTAFEGPHTARPSTAGVDAPQEGAD